MTQFMQIVEPDSQDTQQMKATPAIGIDLGTTHSLVGFVKDGKPVIIPCNNGHKLTPSAVAFDQDQVHVGHEALNQDSVIQSAKRLMGLSLQQAKDLGESDFHAIDEAASDKIVRLKTCGKTVTPIEVSAEILKTLKQQAQDELGHAIDKAVITVPAYFDEAARNATRDAAKIAGLEVLRLINEPTAAALAYGLDSGSEGIYAIYDLGGGTFDLSILKLEKGVFQVLATAGDTNLGGDDFDHALAQKLGVSKTEAKCIKENLNSNTQSITADDFSALIRPYLDRTRLICQSALDDADLNIEDIKGVVLVGGSTRVAAVEDCVADFFKAPVLKTIDPDLAVAYGAALQADALTNGSDTLLLDVTPLSLGIETMGELMEKVIHRNSPIPVAKSQEFTTYQDGQTAMSIHVLQGEREMVSQNRSLGRFELRGIPPMVAGAARIRVTFTLDADGLLTVSAEETTTGTKQSIHIKPSYGLEDDELESMIRAGFENAESDMNQRLLSETIVDANRLLHSLEGAISQDSELLNTDEKQALDKLMSDLRGNIESRDRESMLSCMKKLEKATEGFAQRRMDKSISQALTGQNIETVLKP